MFAEILTSLDNNCNKYINVKFLSTFKRMLTVDL